MDAPRSLLTALLRDGDFKQIIDEGITQKDFHEDAPRKAFEFVREFWLDHKELPTRKTVEQDFPDALLHDPEASEPLSYYVTEVLNDTRFGLLFDGIREAAGEIDTDERVSKTDMDRAAATLSVMLQDYHERGGNLRAVDIARRGSEWWMKYLADAKDNRSIKGIPLGLPALDHNLGGLRPQQLVTITGLPKSGKAQPLTTPVLTPYGWRQMGRLAVGDFVIGSSGAPTRVEAVHPQGVVPTYRVSFSDGGSTEACGEHLWQTLPHNKKERVLTTVEVLALLSSGKTRDLYVPVAGVSQFSATSHLLLEPRLMGLLLGDGSFRPGGPTLSSGDEVLVRYAEVSSPGATSTSQTDNHWVVRFNKGSMPHNPVVSALKTLGLWGRFSVDKFIPEVYLRSSPANRMELLRGLMDADGGMNGKSVCFYTSSEGLRDGVCDLVRGLGGVATVRPKEGEHRVSYTVSIRLPTEAGSPFGLARKSEAWAATGSAQKRPPSRRIVSVEEVEPQDSQCITVAADDSLYVTEDYVVTHNSLVTLRSAIEASRWGYRPLFVSFEMSVTEQEERYHALNSHVSLTRMQQGRLRSSERKKVQKSFRYRERNMGGFIIAEDPHSMTTVTAIASQIETHNPDIVFIDGVYMMDDEQGEDTGSPQALTNITRSLKRLAQKSDVPIVITTQALGWKTTKKHGVTASSTGYSSSYLQDSDVLITINTDEEDVRKKRYTIDLTRTGTPTTAVYVWDFNKTGVLLEVAEDEAEDFSGFDGTDI